jgi:IS1 family transposase
VHNPRALNILQTHPSRNSLQINNFLPKCGSVLIWILGIACVFPSLWLLPQIGKVFNGVGRNHIPSAKAMLIGRLQTVVEVNHSPYHHCVVATAEEFNANSFQNYRDVERVGTLFTFFAGRQCDVFYDCELFPSRFGHAVSIQPRHDLLESEWVGSIINGFKSQFNLNRIFQYSEWIGKLSAADFDGFHIYPLFHSGSLNPSLFQSSLSRLSRLPRLPSNRRQGEQKQQSSYSFRPCEEYVPPHRAILAALCLLAMLGCAYEGARSHGWVAGFYAFNVVALAFCVVEMVGDGHKYDCGNQRDTTQSNQPFQHDAIIVPQKYLDYGVFLGYSNYIEAGMANVLNIDKKIAVIGALAEGSSIRSIERITGIHRDTIMRLGVKVGQGCTAMMDTTMRNLPCQRLEMDEIWGFVGKKARSVQRGDSKEVGDVWTWCAIDSDTKLVPTFMVADRSQAAANAFVADVASRMAYRVQVSTDGFYAYAEAMQKSFGQNVDYGKIIKVYGTHEFGERRYSTSGVLSSEKIVHTGSPNVDLISTSYVERLNATTRLHMRRLTRLTLAFSKKRANFEAAVGLHFGYYNFVKRHNTLKCTPAQAAGVANSQWSVGDLVEAAV